MFYDENQAIRACEEEPSLIFELIKEGHIELVDKLLHKKIVSLMTLDSDGNTVLMRLVRAKQYDVVEKYINNNDYDINYQNKDGNTLAHLVAGKDYIHVASLIKKLKRNRLFTPNIRNNEGKTILDIAVSTNNLCTTLKLIEDKRFNNIDIVSFINLYNTFIKNENFGKYAKLMNLETVINELSKKSRLLPSMQELVRNIRKNFEIIKNELMSNKMTYIDAIMHNVLVEVNV
ncbi:MAG TPA: hypothetical protein IAB45_01150 [Candidatus Onthousia faecavium]|nr:hypothetical protein [Candidatus Onthousia faecavium]